MSPDATGGLRRRVRLLLPVEAPAPAPPVRHRLRVGILGGSFNPAHDGHRYLSVEALRRLDLDRVWWLVAPQNPLKPRAGMLPLADRLAGARKVARHPRILVTALEARLGTRYTADTLRRLRARKDLDLVFLLGADNLAQLPQWHRWTDIVERTPIAVFERHPYSYTALAGQAATRFAGARLSDGRARELAGLEPPAWTFLRLRPHPASSTKIRRRGTDGKDGARDITESDS
jgi:nicotinate-nucleotide adenylyltransferase